MRIKNAVPVLLLLLLAFILTPTVSASTFVGNRSNVNNRRPFAWSNTFISPSETFGGPSPEIAYGAGRFGVVFEDERDGNSEIYFSLLRRNGKKIGLDLRITDDPGNSRNPVITWNGRTFGVFWYDNPVGETRGIYYASISRKGKLLLGPVRINDITADGVHPSMLWNRRTREYGVVWWDSRVGGTYFARVNRQGNVIKEIPVPTSDPSGYYRPLIGISDSEYVVIWEEWVTCISGLCPEMAFARIGFDGNKIGTDAVITAYGATRPKSIIWNGEEYGVLAGLGHYAKLLRISSKGDIIEPPIDLGNVMMSNARMTWNGRKYALTWVDDRWKTTDHPDNSEVAFRKFDQYGNFMSDIIRVSNAAGPSWNSSAPIWTGSSYAIVWVENLYQPNQSVYFAQGR